MTYKNKTTDTFFFHLRLQSTPFIRVHTRNKSRRRLTFYRGRKVRYFVPPEVIIDGMGGVSREPVVILTLTKFFNLWRVIKGLVL